jgi:dimethylhistidine N-methyltransferase
MALAIHLHEAQHREASASLRDDTLQGFAATPKWASPKHFYDRRGSELFELICRQPEYYPTRIEEAILARFASAIAERIGPGRSLIELGSGASRKVRLLLEACRPARYLGIDISADFLCSSTLRLAADYPWLAVHAVCADYSQPMSMPADFHAQRPLAFFPGSSIGNFTPLQAQDFLHNLKALLPAGSELLVGVDLVKAPHVLDAAYNDAAGVTAAFNRNLLWRIRRELDSDLQPDAFDHLAFFNAEESRVEMHLISTCNQEIRVEGQTFGFARGESLHTENSYKYSIEGFQALAKKSGYCPVAVWTDPGQLFSVHLLQRC